MVRVRAPFARTISEGSRMKQRSRSGGLWLSDFAQISSFIGPSGAFCGLASSWRGRGRTAWLLPELAGVVRCPVSACAFQLKTSVMQLRWAPGDVPGLDRQVLRRSDGVRRVAPRLRGGSAGDNVAAERQAALNPSGLGTLWMLPNLRTCEGWPGGPRQTRPATQGRRLMEIDGNLRSVAPERKPSTVGSNPTGSPGVRTRCRSPLRYPLQRSRGPQLRAISPHGPCRSQPVRPSAIRGAGSPVRRVLRR